MKPWLLDLFCGAGGAAMGYHRVGFEVVGVDIAPQPRYPFEFIQADALEYIADHGHEYDAIHASPPCQGYSVMNNLPWLKGKEYPLLILPTMEMLEALGKPYVLENVMGARYGAKGLTKRGIEAHGLKAGWLCGMMFGLPFYRHRLFATNWLWLAPGHPKHTFQQGMPGSPLPRGAWEDRRTNPVNTAWRQYHDGQWRLKDKKISGFVVNGDVQNVSGWRLAAKAMGVDWMKRDELTQAIPPTYTEFIGRALMQAVRAALEPAPEEPKASDA